MVTHDRAFLDRVSTSVLSFEGDGAVVEYRCTAFYHPESEGSIHWKDAQIGIDWAQSGWDWGTEGPILSEKDAAAPTLEEAGWPFA